MRVVDKHVHITLPDALQPSRHTRHFLNSRRYGIKFDSPEIQLSPVLEMDTETEKFTGVDRKSRSITLSIKAKDHQEESEALQDYTRSSSGGATTTLGDIFKEKLESKTD